MREKKMKNWVMVRPRKGKEWTIFVLMLVNVLVSISPIMNLYNTSTLFLGFPTLLVLAFLTLVVVIIVVNIAYRWGVK